MLSHDKRNTDLKKTILRDIYVDNLKFAGKDVQGVDPDDEPTTKRKSHIRILRMIMVVFVLVTSFFTYDLTREQAPNASQPDKSFMEKSDIIDSVKKTMGSMDLAMEQPVAASTQLLCKSENWDWQAPTDQSLADFDLLLSSNDPVRLSSVFGLGVKTIVIDPGHGGRDPGAIGADGTKEKYITLDVAIKLRKRLTALNLYEVLLTRENDRTLSLADRVEYAKANSADLFISLHVNSLPQKDVNLIESYYFGPPLNIQSLRAAERENKASKFSVGELGAIVKDFGNTVKRQESASLAVNIQKSLFRNMKHQDENILDSGIKMAPFVVLSQIEVPSVLIEISCISKAEEEAKLSLTSYRDKVAKYIEEGIVSYLETQQLKIAKGES
jgi:N-acetylmuramoyl-L-alanine amidase